MYAVLAFLKFQVNFESRNQIWQCLETLLPFSLNRLPSMKNKEERFLNNAIISLTICITTVQLKVFPASFYYSLSVPQLRHLNVGIAELYIRKCI